jgi:phage gp46-like protein
MTDIATRFIDLAAGADLVLDELLLEDDDGLTTAVVISVFTDRQARADDILPNADQGETDRRGWCGDDLNTNVADRIGSRSWLNESAKQLQAVLTSDRQYLEECLAWMVKDGVASKVIVRTFAPQQGVRAALVEIHRPKKTVARYQFPYFWSNGNGI